MTTKEIDRIRGSRDTIDDLLNAIYRLRNIDRDTGDAELELQTLIEHEFDEMDAALDRLEDNSK